MVTTMQGVGKLARYSVLLLIITLFSILFAGNILVGSILGVISTILIGVITNLISRNNETTIPKNTRIPKKDEIAEKDECRVMLYGLHRSGKTTLIKTYLTDAEPSSEESTEHYDVYPDKRRLRLGGPEYSIAIADYRGENPGQVILKPSSQFFGSEDYRLINAVFFLVDLFPSVPNSKESPQEYEDFIKSYEHNAMAKIEDRINANLRYVNEFSIRLVLEVVYNRENLFFLRLLINKINVLEEILSRGYLPGQDTDSMKTIILEKYGLVIRTLTKASSPSQNDIKHFRVDFVNACSIESVRRLFTEVLNVYSERAR